MTKSFCMCLIQTNKLWDLKNLVVFSQGFFVPCNLTLFILLAKDSKKAYYFMNLKTQSLEA